jgi:hypothetical protein
MSHPTFLNPDQLHDRPWRSAGHPFNRQLSAKRRWTMLLVFALLCALIGGYLFITDSRRVKVMAENELSKLIGGPVVVGRAKLSLFEGLRLEYVNVYVDDQEREGLVTVLRQAVPRQLRSAAAAGRQAEAHADRRGRSARAVDGKSRHRQVELPAATDGGVDVAQHLVRAAPGPAGSDPAERAGRLRGDSQRREAGRSGR